MVTIAIVVSRVEAAVLVSLLEAGGIPAIAGGVHHASVEVNSLALGGHRIWVPASRWVEASAIFREAGADREWHFSKGLQRAVLRFLALWVGLNGGIVAFFAAGGAFLPWTLWAIPLSVLSVPVNPQGRCEYYLAAGEA